MRRKVIVDCKQTGTRYEVLVGCRLVNSAGRWARKILGRDARRVAIISDTRVAPLYGQIVESELRSNGFDAMLHVVRGGERRKDLLTVKAVLERLAEAGITRSDAVLALGGGVVGDIAGFASAIYLRGVRFLNIPTTLLAMIDASVGGKTGVNSSAGKNQIGSFYQPAGVLIDPDLLATLPGRELTGGLCEAIKHGAVSGRTLLNAVHKFLSTYPQGPSWPSDARFRSAITDLIASHVSYKASVVSTDEREDPNRCDKNSRKILNFGHTLAHALERVTGYKYLRHGEAVGHGILFAAYLSKNLDICPEKDVQSLNDVVHLAGTLPSIANIQEREVLEAFGSDKKNTSGSLQMVLLKGIGKPVIVPFAQIPANSVHRAYEQLLKG